MGSVGGDTPEYRAVICPVCQTRLYTKTADQATEIECHDCLTMVEVPAHESVSSSRFQKKAGEEVGTYQIAAVDETEKRQRPVGGEAEFVKIICPYCRTQLHPQLKKKSHHVTCPDCLEIIDVPSLDDARAKGQTRKKKRRQRDVGTYNLPTVAELANHLDPLLQKTIDDEDVRTGIRAQPPPPIPHWTFFTGVFNYAWRADARLRWIYLTIGFTALGELVAAVFLLWKSGFIFGIPFLGLPLVWISIWTLSFASSCWAAILEDTAAGNDEIYNWPVADYREWVAKMIALGSIAVLCALPSWGAGVLVREFISPGWYWPVFGGLLFVLYPIILLSSLECGSGWMPWSPPVLKSVVRLWWGWLLYYLLSTGLAAVYGGLLFAGLMSGWSWLLFLLTAPILSAMVFSHGRLLGRLAWRGIVRPQK